MGTNARKGKTLIVKVDKNVGLWTEERIKTLTKGSDGTKSMSRSD